MEEETKENYFVQLCENPVRFEPVSKVTNVFFDESNKQLFTVRSGGVTGVQVQGPTQDKCLSFRMPDKGPVVSIKLSPLQNILALQRTKSTVEFMNLKEKELEDQEEYSQSSKNKNTVVYGFVWTQPDEIVIVTDQGVELFQVLPEKRLLKALRSISVNLNWFVSCPVTKKLLLACGSSSSNMQPISCSQPGAINKLPKFQIDIPVTSTKGTLLERDVTICQLYGSTCVLVLRHPPRPPGSPVPGAQVLVYTIHKSLHTARKTHVLCLESTGRFALSIVDNLIIVHHQASRTSLLFDVGGDVSDMSTPTALKSVLQPRTIRPCYIDLSGQDRFKCQLYSANWVVFQPNIIIDAKFGCLWYVEMNLPSLVKLATDAVKLIDVLLHRNPASATELIIKVLQEVTNPCNETKSDLKVVGEIFDMINRPYRKQLNCQAQSHIGTPAGSSHPVKYSEPDSIVIDQSTMYSHVFSKFPEMKHLPEYDGEYGIKVLLEYIRSLSDAQITVQDLNELVITCLLQEKHGLSRLHQLLQYRVLPDSKPLACTLLSLENVYPPALQLALDMLKRLGNADDEIIEILLHKQLILPTLRFARSVGLVDQISARKFLEAAQAMQDPGLYFSVYKFLVQRNVRLKGNCSFAKGEHCDNLVQHFKTLFPYNTSVDNATT